MLLLWRRRTLAVAVTRVMRIVQHFCVFENEEWEVTTGVCDPQTININCWEFKED